MRSRPPTAPHRRALLARTEHLFPSVACLPLAALLLSSASVSPAATIVVDSAADPGDAGTCTLRQAIVSMNTGALAGNCANTGGAFGSSDAINFAGSLFSANQATVTLADTPNNVLGIHRGTVGVDSYMNLAIDAGVGRTVTVQRPANAQNAFSVFDATMGYSNHIGTRIGSLHLTGLVVRNGLGNAVNRWAPKYSNNAMYSTGGGIHVALSNVTLDRCEIRDNQAIQGAGVFVLGGSLTVNSSTVSGNAAGDAGFQGYGQYAHYGWGGGIFIAGPGGVLAVADSVISGNSADGFRGGGGIAAVAADVSVVNSTISGNSAPNALATRTKPDNTTQTIVFHGAAISARYQLNPISLLNSTIACNDGAVDAISSSVPTIAAVSTIFADTSNSRCTTQTPHETILTGSPLAGDHDLVVSSSALVPGATFPSDMIFGDPLLGPLQNNGGPTSTHALGAGSPALDNGSNPGGASEDQRGSPFGRWVGSNPDIGAFEDQTAHLCGSAWGGSFVSMSPGTPNLCNSGAYLQGGPYGSGPWSWFCAANANPANNEFCGAKVLATASLLIENASGGIVSSAVFGQPLHLKTVVSGGSSTPTGTATFADVTGGGFIPLCVDLPLSGGETVCDTTNTPVGAGARQLKAIYNGNATFGAASSSPGSIQINPADTTTAIASQTPEPVDIGTPFTVVAQVGVSAPSLATPVGTVEVDDQTDGLSCTYDLLAPMPGCALTPVSAGTHSLHVAYLGNGNINGSFATGTETVTAPQLSLTVDDGAAFARYGQTLQYVLNLTNTGNGAATALAVNGTPSANFAGATLQWQCGTTNGATCAVSGSGSVLTDTVTLPADSSLTWTVNVTVPASASGSTVQFDAGAAGVGTVSDVDALVIFRDGFGQ